MFTLHLICSGIVISYPMVIVIISPTSRQCFNLFPFIVIVKDAHNKYVATLSGSLREGNWHTVSRSSVLTYVLQLHASEDTCNEYPFQVEFIDEAGVDLGGVTRDMYSAFWEMAYNTLFDGSNILIPLMKAGMEQNTFVHLGRVIIHGFLTSEMLPTRIAFPVLACSLLSPMAKISEEILVASFIDFLAPYEGDMVKQALKEVNDQPAQEFTGQHALDNLFSRYGARKKPSKTNIRSMIQEIAELMFIIQPLPACHMIHSGIPNNHRQFWASLTVEELLALYQAMSLNVPKVIEPITEPIFLSKNEERVFGYLLECVGNLSVGELALFLRFVTGSAVYCDRKIEIQFNGLSGFARRPIAHCCSCILELSSEYESFRDFDSEIKAVINNELAFIMNAM